MNTDRHREEKNSEPPDWHREYLAGREKALANGEDSFISLDELEADLRNISIGQKKPVVNNF